VNLISNLGLVYSIIEKRGMLTFGETNCGKLDEPLSLHSGSSSEYGYCIIMPPSIIIN
jgi:hypothetical protein